MELFTNPRDESFFQERNAVKMNAKVLTAVYDFGTQTQDQSRTKMHEN